jgi:colicin import membrane protein
MPRRLNSYQTSLGFFDLAVAAPSMKAAAEAWGSRPDDFKRGFAKRTDDPAIVAATMAKPGVVLMRPVGSKGTFIEHAKLPKGLPVGAVEERPVRPRSTTKEPPSKLHDKDAREAALAFAREQKQRNRARQKQEAAREKDRKRREQAIAKAQTALEQATRKHESNAKKIEHDRAVLDRRLQAEDARWEKQKEKLETALRRAHD